MPSSRLACLAAMSCLAGCIPIWFTQYRLTSSDGATSTTNSESSYSTLNWDPGRGAKVDVMVDADTRRPTGMLVLFHATVPAGTNPGIVGDSVELVDCPPNKAGPLKLKYIAAQPTDDHKVFFQWYVDVPGRPDRCRFKPPTFVFGDQHWDVPTILAVRGTTAPITVDLTNQPKH